MGNDDEQQLHHSGSVDHEGYSTSSDPHMPAPSPFPPPLALRTTAILDALTHATAHSLSSLSGYTHDTAVASLISHYSRTLPTSLIIMFFLADQWIPHIHTTPDATHMLPYLTSLRLIAHKPHDSPTTPLHLCPNLECQPLPPPPIPVSVDSEAELAWAATALTRRFSTGLAKIGPKCTHHHHPHTQALWYAPWTCAAHR